jgi:hypothetical protein
MAKGEELESKAQGSLDGPRYQIPVNQTEGDLVLDLLKDGAPLFSSNPGCPVLGFQIYADDGTGTVVGDSQPVEVRMEEESVNLHSRFIVNSAAAIGKLIEG